MKYTCIVLSILLHILWLRGHTKHTQGYTCQTFNTIFNANHSWYKYTVQKVTEIWNIIANTCIKELLIFTWIPSIKVKLALFINLVYYAVQNQKKSQNEVDLEILTLTSNMKTPNNLVKNSNKKVQLWNLWMETIPLVF